MSAEEYHGNSPETGVENKELTQEQLEKRLSVEASLEAKAEKSNVESGEASEKRARHEALEKAISVERGGAEKEKKPAPAQRRHGVVSKKQRNTNYKKTLKTVQAELKPTQRAFSKVIHNPAVEKTSEIVSSTIARPNAILSGAIVAFVVVLAVYLVAKHFGYMLSGFETIAAFAVGWILGLLYDFFKVMITGKKA